MLMLILFASILFGLLLFHENPRSKLEIEEKKKLLEWVERNFPVVPTLKLSRDEELLKWNTPKLLKEGL